MSKVNQEMKDEINASGPHRLSSYCVLRCLAQALTLKLCNTVSVQPPPPGAGLKQSDVVRVGCQSHREFEVTSFHVSALRFARNTDSPTYLRGCGAE